jgi:DNA or RNA helicases of superfamily II
MDRYTAVPFIGLSATPYSKGLGLAYDDLILPITPSTLLDRGYLTPVKYYGGTSVDTKGVRGRALQTGGTDFDPVQLASATEKDVTLTGDIIKNWIKHAEGRQTIAFSPSIKHSRDMVDQFNQAGIPAVHIDGYMDDEERQIIYQAHDRGEFLILSCSRLLNVGYDAPKVSCLIDCFPTKSLIAYVQRAGRIMRTFDGKEDAIYLDHAGNVNRHGFAEHIVPDSLDRGDRRFTEKRQAKKEKTSKPKTAPNVS